MTRAEVLALLATPGQWLRDNSVQLQGKGNSMTTQSAAASDSQVLTADGSGGCEWGAQLFAGSGTPESVVTAPVGALFVRTDGGAGTTLYVKESGTGNTGWVGK